MDLHLNEEIHVELIAIEAGGLLKWKGGWEKENKNEMTIWLYIWLLSE
jgi:hypothetical protein